MKLLILFLFFMGLPAYSDSGRAEVLNQLALFNIMNHIDDYKPVVKPLVVRLDEGETENNEIYMKKNRQYKLTVVCDDDCDDVGVWLYDSDGNEIDADTDGDDTAILTGRPDESGKYFIKIRVEDCDKEPCYVGAQLFSR